MSAGEGLAGLRRLADLAMASGDAEMVELGGDLALWLSGRDERSLEQLFGIGGQQSRRSARTIAGIAGRNGWLRRGAAECGVDAAEMAEAAARFFAINWPRDGHLPECPARYVGHLEFYLWNAMKCWSVPVKMRQLSSILGNERRDLIAEDLCDGRSGRESTR